MGDHGQAFDVAAFGYLLEVLCTFRDSDLRHLHINPHFRDVLAAMSSYIGTARDFLLLLEELVASNQSYEHQHSKVE
ncbi:hypothetical protein Cni_G18428 [Canna indica]|uniref:Uncharacterized protein n=1 Tax=Canna indica TaxID=4628 RepID=A0AAQ3QIQ5_9LILI|nr:hypothetical protein Cni_G18428 [Canna indica]